MPFSTNTSDVEFNSKTENQIKIVCIITWVISRPAPQPVIGGNKNFLLVRKSGNQQPIVFCNVSHPFCPSFSLRGELPSLLGRLHKTLLPFLVKESFQSSNIGIQNPILHLFIYWFPSLFQRISLNSLRINRHTEKCKRFCIHQSIVQYQTIGDFCWTVPYLGNFYSESGEWRSRGEGKLILAGFCCLNAPRLHLSTQFSRTTDHDVMI